VDRQAVGAADSKLVEFVFVSVDGFQNQLERINRASGTVVVVGTRWASERLGAKYSAVHSQFRHRLGDVVFLAPRWRRIHVPAAAPLADGSRTSRTAVSKYRQRCDRGGAWLFVGRNDPRIAGGIGFLAHRRTVFGAVGRGYSIRCLNSPGRNNPCDNSCVALPVFARRQYHGNYFARLVFGCGDR